MTVMCRQPFPNLKVCVTNRHHILLEILKAAEAKEVKLAIAGGRVARLGSLVVEVATLANPLAVLANTASSEAIVVNLVEVSWL